MTLERKIGIGLGLFVAIVGIVVVVILLNNVYTTQASPSFSGSVTSSADNATTSVVFLSTTATSTVITVDSADLLGADKIAYQIYATASSTATQLIWYEEASFDGEDWFRVIDVTSGTAPRTEYTASTTFSIMTTVPIAQAGVTSTTSPFVTKFGDVVGARHRLRMNVVGADASVWVRAVLRKEIR